MTKKWTIEVDDDAETFPKPKKLRNGDQMVVAANRAAEPPPLLKLDGPSTAPDDPDLDEETQSLASADISLEPETQLVLNELWLEQRQHAALRATHDSMMAKTVTAVVEVMAETCSEMRQMRLEMQELRRLTEGSPEASNRQLAPVPAPQAPPTAAEVPALSIGDYESVELTPLGPKQKKFSLLRLSPSGIRATIRGIWDGI